MPILGAGGEGEDEAFFTRHSKATYGTYGKMLSSDDPTRPFNPDDQVTPDLSESGFQLAREKAVEFFDKLDPEKDILFFASSNEARALETANVYREVAIERGFEISRPENSRSSLSDSMAGGDIRVIRPLSIYPSGETNTVIDSVFNPPARRGNINWSAIDPELKARFDEASKIIEADDRGAFGPNFAAHSDAVKKIFPEIKTAEELFKTRFTHIINLVKFGLNKAKEAGLDKNVKILGFGHENYMVYALDEIFKEEGIGNCESVSFDVSDGEVSAQYRGKNEKIG